MSTLRTFFIAIGALLTSTGSNAAEFYTEIQAGSLMGLAHISGGVQLAERHHIQAGIGYVPKLDSHAEMTLISLRYRYEAPLEFDIKGFTLKPFNIGTGILIGSHDELFATLPDRYPDGYYMPSAIRLVFNYQATLQLNKHWEVFFDISALDVGLLGYVREPDFYYNNYSILGLSGITNWGFGSRYFF